MWSRCVCGGGGGGCGCRWLVVVGCVWVGSRCSLGVCVCGGGGGGCGQGVCVVIVGAGDMVSEGAPGQPHC